MVAGTPPVLPPGYISLFQAMECVDPGLLSDIGTDEERREFEKFVSMSKRQTDRDGNVLAPPAVHEEFVRRHRRREAYNRICGLCAYGTVPSALLLDDFTLRAGVPSIFWLNERFSANMRETGRAPVTKPWSKYAVDGPSGWVMIDTATFRTVIAPGITSAAPSVSAPRPDPEDAGSPQEPRAAAGTRAKAPTRPIRISASPKKIKAAVDEWVKEPRVRPMKRDDFVREFQDLMNFTRPAARAAYGMLPDRLKHRVGRPENRQ